jgi:uncharacterized protein (DUF2141 family)
MKTDSKPDLMIKLTKLTDRTHNIFVAVSTYNSGFPNKLDIVRQFVLNPVENKDLSVTVKDLPYGKYAVSVFQDINGNEKLDKGLFGIPAEPFAFSNNFHPRLRAPKWEDCEFEYMQSQT